MGFEIKKMLGDLKIPYKEHGKNWQPGWLQIKCPCCDDHEMHGGFNLTYGNYNCWRCGKHRVTEVISIILGITKSEAWHVIKGYRTAYIPKIQDRKRATSSILKLPECTPLKKQHKKYLIGRNFDPKKLENDWDLMGTNHLGDYKFRIIAPIYLKNRLISFQGRDITGQSTLRYQACPIKNEVINHKHSLYGIDFVSNRRTIVVEGITDVWRLGKGTVATFGTSFKLEQILLLKEYVDYCAILFDRSAAAQQHAYQLDVSLQSMGVQTEIFELDDCEDPAKLPQEEADKFTKSIIK